MYTFAGCPRIKRGLRTWGLLWRFGCHVEKLRRRISTKSLNQRAYSVYLSRVLSLSPLTTCSGIIKPTLRNAYLQPQGQTQPQSLSHVLDTFVSLRSQFCCASAHS